MGFVVANCHHVLLDFALSNRGLSKLLSVLEETLGNSVGDDASHGHSPAHSKQHIEVKPELPDSHGDSVTLEEVDRP